MEAEHPSRATPTWSRRAWIAVVFVALIAHLPALSAGYVWDDIALAGHPVFADLDGLRRIWTEAGAVQGEVHYWPLTYTSLWIDEHVFGAGPFGHHFVNVLLHAANAVLLGLVLQRMAFCGAWIAALLFAVHPVHVESVAWVIERKDLLATTFYGLAFLAWLRFDGERARLGALVVAVACFACAMLSKSVALGLPLVLGAAQWWRRGRITRRDVLALLPFVAVGGVLAALDVARSREIDPYDLGFGWSEKLLVSSRSFWFYVEKLAWPVDLVPIQPRWTIDVGAPLAWLPVMALVALFAGAWALRGRIGRGPFFAASFFLVTLAPTLGWIDFAFLRYTFVADRFQYLASAAPIALFGAGLARIEISRAVRRSIVVVLVALLGVASFRQSGWFANDERLFGRNVEVNPSAWAAWVNLGLARLDRGDAEGALPCLERAVELAPRDAPARTNLGAVLNELDRLPEAVASFEEALRLDPTSPRAHERLGLTLERLGRRDEALAHYRRALELAPELEVARFNLGMALAQAGDLERARDELRELAARQPSNAKFRTAFAKVLAARGELELARDELAAALKLQPDLEEARELSTAVEARLHP
ncbi:MAG: tetratricopeptide repeat protein [Planctomycetes bacterium]|nr:tetratricopeptide repeat protein [Planctomycetota bacterium]